MASMVRQDWNGFSSEWYWDQHRLRGRSHELTDGALIGIVAKHGKLAWDELTTLAGSGNFKRYADALVTLRPAFGPQRNGCFDV